MIYSLTILISLIPATLALRKITVDNQCKGTVWPAISGPNPTKMDGTPQPFGWKQPPGKYSFQVPDSWPKSRVWARTGCNDDGTGCKTGVCPGETCTGTFGGPGATLAEFTFKPGDFWYDVSMVDGFNLPMSISGSGDCPTGSCGVGEGNDILGMCDKRLVFPAGSKTVWGCVSPCNNGKQLSPSFDWNNSPWCCRASGTAINPQSKCTPDMIPFYKKYKPHCQKAYVYPADDNGNLPDKAVYTCASGDFTITLCPGGVGQGTAPTSAPITVDPGISGVLGRRRADFAQDS